MTMESTDQLEPKDRLKKIARRQSLKVAAPMEQFTSWTIGSVVAALSFLLSNIDAVVKIVPAGAVAWASFVFLFYLG